jgi:hypothetical protein
MQSIKEVEEQEWTEKGTIISISGKRKFEKRGANVRRANDERLPEERGAPWLRVSGL